MKNLVNKESIKLRAGKQVYYGKILDKVVRLVLFPSEGYRVKLDFVNMLERDWGKVFSLGKNKKYEFEIVVADDLGGGGEIIKQNNVVYFSSYKYGKKKITISYFVGVSQFSRMMMEVSFQILGNRGFILHASSCLDPDEKKLYLFSANSGGGKSTTAKMLEKSGWSHFSDDTVVVMKDKFGWKYFGPNYPEKKYGANNLSTNRSAGIYFVNKESKKVRVEPVSDKVSFFKLLLSQVWAYNDKLSEIQTKLVFSYVKNNDCFVLYRNLNKKSLLEVL